VTLEVEARLFDAANSTQVAALSGAYDVQWQDVRNGLGNFSFKLALADADFPSLSFGLTFRGLINGTAKWAGVIEQFKPVPVDAGMEDIEAVEVSGRGLLQQLAECAVLQAPTAVAAPPPGAVAELSPPIDEREFEWYGLDFDDSDGASAYNWVASTELATMGESSAVFPGLPAGMPAIGAKWIWTGSGTTEYRLFRQWVSVSAGPLCLDFASEDAGVYINGRRFGTNSAYQEKQRVEFEATSSGYILLAFEARIGVVAGGGQGLVWNLTVGPEGATVATSGSACYVYSQASSTPNMTVGGVMLAMKADHAALTGWTFDFTATAATDSASLTATSGIPLRIGDDSVFDALLQYSDVYADFDVAATGKTLKIWNKGDHDVASALALVVGNSTAGAADPTTVNVLQLEWDIRQASFDALLVRWSGGRFTWPATLPAVPRWRSLGLPNIASAALAETFATAFLANLGVNTFSPTFDFLPTSSAQYPYTIFDKFSTLDVPLPSDLNTTAPQNVQAVTIQQDEDGMMKVAVETGTLQESRATYLQRWINRSSRGGAGGQFYAAGQIVGENIARATSTTATDVILFSARNAASGDVSSRTSPQTGRINSLRLAGQGAAATSTVSVVINGNTYTLSGASGGTGYTVLDTDEAVLQTVNIRSVIALTATTVAHPSLDVIASYSEIIA
jgi:hypothetical protein